MRLPPRPGTRRPPLVTDAQLELLLAPLIHADKVDEATFQRIVVKLAEAYGWAVSHAARSQLGGRWVTAAAKGFPDLVLVKDRVVFLELKTVKGRTSPEQLQWLKRLQAVGGTVEAYVVNPRQVRALVKLLAELPGDRPGAGG